jgi:hypothetical protein
MRLARGLARDNQSKPHSLHGHMPMAISAAAAHRFPCAAKVRMDCVAFPEILFSPALGSRATEEHMDA